jgi:hypothetical protein
MSSPPSCPFCGAGAAKRVGQWGGQIITSQWRCTSCNSYFEAVRDDFSDDRFAPPTASTPATER